MMAKVPKNTKIYYRGHVYTEGQEMPEGLVEKEQPKKEPKTKEPKKDK